MAKQSGYLKRILAEKSATMNSTETIIKQFMIDTLQITMNQREGYGYDRIMRLMEEWEQKRKEYSPALNPRKDSEADVAQEHMDRAIKQIIKDRVEIIPFKDRYPNLREVTYDKRK